MTTDLTKGNPAKVIFIYSLPIILGNAFQQIYNLVDVAIIGRYVNYQALAGVGVTNGLGFFVLGFVLGITSGLGIKAAQYFGAGDLKTLKRSVATSLMICMALALTLTAVSVLLSVPMLRLIGACDDILPYARDYIVLIFAGTTAPIAYNIVACILRAMGDSRTPLFFLIFSSVLNVCLDVMFIASFGWGVRGAAFATVLSQGLSALFCFYYAFRKYPAIHLSREDFRIDLSFVREHLRIGLPMAFQFSITAIGLILLQAALDTFPSTYIAGYTAANKVQNVGFLVATAFGVAIANFAGQNYGAGMMDRVRRGVRATVSMCLVACFGASLVMWFFDDQLTSIFLDSATRDPEIYSASSLYLHASAVFFPFLYLLIIYRNALQGIGYAFWPMMAGVLELLIRAAASFTLPYSMGYNGVVLIDPLAWIGAFVLLIVCYFLRMNRAGGSVSGAPGRL